MGDISTSYKFSGNVETKNRQTVMSEKIMQVSKIYFKEGDTVKAGDILIKTSVGEQIKAKINGEIVNLDIEEGAQVMAGKKLMSIVDYDHLQVSVKVDEYDLTAVAKDKETTVSIGGIKKELTGTISSISKEGTSGNGITFFTAIIDLAKDADLRIGMSAEVTMENESVTGVVRLPMTAIQFDEENKAYVLKKGENNTYIKTGITTGINDGTTVEIKNGVVAGETIFYTKTKAGSTGFGGMRNREGVASGRNS
jgi:HlyD family secretion protein